MRPRSFADFYGQSKLLGEKAPLRRIIAEERFSSLIFWGPPGTGKTTLANLIAQATQRDLITLSAVSCGVKDIRQALDLSEQKRAHGKKSLLLFLDEIHRLSTNQQDVLLPALESGLVKFIGATTENPSFNVNKGILSRSLVFYFELLTFEELVEILQKALLKERPKLATTIPLNYLHNLARAAVGDARRALHLLESLLVLLGDDEQLDPTEMQTLLSAMALPFDHKGESHYDTISAMIKSVRASHPDAALHYLAKALAGGEDPEFIARRLIILASEDIGNANPHALTWATSAATAVQMLGMPEARIILAQVLTLLAASPKSNRAYVGIETALADIKKYPELEIPYQLRNAPTTLMKEWGYGQGYVYAHDDLEKAKQMEYLPAKLKGRVYYQPGNQGYEQNIQLSLQKLKPH